MAVLEKERESDKENGWLQTRAAKEARKDRLKLSDKVGEMFALLALALLTSFFVYHQITQTGFFTSAFGLGEMILFYTPVPIATFAILLKVIPGRRNIARPVDTLNSLVLAIVGFQFFAVFPFDFSHLGDVLPFSLGFIVSWIPNWIMRGMFLLIGTVSVVQTLYTPILYFATRRELAKRGVAKVPRSSYS